MKLEEVLESFFEISANFRVPSRGKCQFVDVDSPSITQLLKELSLDSVEVIGEGEQAGVPFLNFGEEIVRVEMTRFEDGLNRLFVGIGVECQVPDKAKVVLVEDFFVKGAIEQVFFLI